MKKSVVAIVMVGATLAACNNGKVPPTPRVDTGSIAAALKAEEVQWVKDFASKDVDRVSGHYAQDATLMLPGSPAVTGMAEIRKVMAGMIADPNLALTFSSQKSEVAQSGELAYTRGTYSLTLTNPKTKQPETQTGSYITSFKKKADGSWKAEDDIVTPGSPSSPAG